MTLLEGADLRIAFGGVAAVAGASIAVEAGALHGLIGPNGAGKTTLLRLLAGVLRPRAGRVRFRGRDVTAAPVHARARAGLAMTHQIVRPFRAMTLAENVAIAAGHAVTARPWRALLRCDPGDAPARALALLARFGIADAADKPAATVPLGVLKRLEMARALALDPALLLLDEPLAGLNAGEAAEIADVIAGLPRDGVTVLLVEHNLGQVVRIATRLTVLDQGRVLAEGAPAAVMARPEVRAAYLGAEADGAGDR